MTTSFNKISSDQSGVDFVNTLDDNPKTDRNVLSYHHYYIRAGIAGGDVNNDCKTDIFFAANEQENRLYLNQGDFKFKDVAEGSGINPSNKY